MPDTPMTSTSNPIDVPGGAAAPAGATASAARLRLGARDLGFCACRAFAMGAAPGGGRRHWYEWGVRGSG